jgi:GH18 family chitinase
MSSSAGPSNYYNIDLPQICPQLNWINLMTYNFAVASSEITSFVAPLFPALDDPAPPDTRATHYVDAAVRAYLAAGVCDQTLEAGCRSNLSRGSDRESP